MSIKHGEIWQAYDARTDLQRRRVLITATTVVGANRYLSDTLIEIEEDTTQASEANGYVGS